MTGYVLEKIKVLRQLEIRVTKQQKAHMFNLASEIAVDNYARKLILEANWDSYK